MNREEFSKLLDEADRLYTGNDYWIHFLIYRVPEELQRSFREAIWRESSQYYECLNIRLRKANQPLVSPHSNRDSWKEAVLSRIFPDPPCPVCGGVTTKAQIVDDAGHEYLDRTEFRRCLRCNYVYR